FSDGRERSQIPAYVVDGAAFAAIQPGFPEGLDAGIDPVPFVASPALGAALGGGDYTIEGRAAEAVGTADGAVGIDGGEWLLVDRGASERRGAGLFPPRIVVAGLADGAEAEAVAAALSTELGARARVSTLDDRISQQRATPI